MVILHNYSMAVKTGQKTSNIILSFFAVTLFFIAPYILLVSYNSGARLFFLAMLLLFIPIVIVRWLKDIPTWIWLGWIALLVGSYVLTTSEDSKNLANECKYFSKCSVSENDLLCDGSKIIVSMESLKRRCPGITFQK